MTRPTKHPKSGVYRVRIAVPLDLRAIVGKGELIVSLRTKDCAEAKQRFPPVLARLEAILEAARVEVAGQAAPLSAREVDALAGDVYRQDVQAAEDNPGSVTMREALHARLLDRLGGAWGDDREDEREFVPGEADVAEARLMLAHRGTATDAETLRRLAVAIFGARTHAAAVAVRRAASDWSPDPDASRFPAPRPVASPALVSPVSSASPKAPRMALDDLLTRFARENPQPGKSLARREGAMRRLRKVSKQDDAASIDKATVRALKEKRLAEASAATVRADIATLRPIWGWAIDNDLLPGPNPFARMSPKVRKSSADNRLPFAEEEAAAILSAARQDSGWMRWVPWVLAFTGARLGEVCDAAAGDVRKVHGVWCLAVHSEDGRTLKTEQSQRMVPLADALIAEGFVGYATALPKGSPLFPDLTLGAWGKRSSNATKPMGKRLRGLGIKDKRKVAAHSWRHRMKDLLRFARIPEEAADAILGHDNPVNSGRGYGVGWRARPDETKPELEKSALVPPGLAVGGL